MLLGGQDQSTKDTVRDTRLSNVTRAGLSSSPPWGGGPWWAKWARGRACPGPLSLAVARTEARLPSPAHSPSCQQSHLCIYGMFFFLFFFSFLFFF